MATIYKAPSEIKTPSFNIDSWKQEEERYLNEVREFCTTHGSGKNKGEIIRIPMADSSADYMVFSMRPLKLVHLEIGDAWHSSFAELLTAKKVNEMIDRDKALSKLF